jgi:hypothetical protein
MQISLIAAQFFRRRKPTMTHDDADKKQIPARDYIQASFHPDDRIAVLVRNRRRGETIQRITTAARAADPSFQEWLRFKNEREAADIYIGMNTLKREARTRTKEDIEVIRHLFVDLDLNGPASLSAIEKSNQLPPPNYVLNTSPEKYQIIWKVEEIAREEAEGLQHAMAREFDGDPAATDSTRVLRMPGFLNRKYDQHFVVSVEFKSGSTHHLQDFKLRTEPPEGSHRGSRGDQRTRDSGQRPLSQSEYDWAYAKRALARGEDPEEVARHIAAFRKGSKADPEYYARLTVKNALSDVQNYSLRSTSQ